MSKSKKGATSAPNAKMSIRYVVLRNISSPTDKAAGRTIYRGQVRAHELRDLPNDENVRGEIESRTRVKRDIQETLETDPELFAVLNGGVTIVARQASVKDNERLIRLEGASIVNGAQTQGVVNTYLKDLEGGLEGDEDLQTVGDDLPLLQIEVIVTDDEELITRTTIARNNQHKVQNISIRGTEGVFDNLVKAVPNVVWATNETEAGESPEKLIQLLTAMMPKSVAGKKSFLPHKAYSGKARAVDAFARLHVAIRDNKASQEQVKKHEYFLGAARLAWSLYRKWKSHQGFQGTRLRSIVRDNGTIVEVPDGIIFPIIGAYSPIIVQNGSLWDVASTLDPEVLERNLIAQACEQYMSAAGSKPYQMGRTESVYQALRGPVQMLADMAL